jgi:hypothetical protein
MEESFFVNPDYELLDRPRLCTSEKVERALVKFVQGSYNARSCRSASNHYSPIEHEPNHFGVTHDTNPELFNKAD